MNLTKQDVKIGFIGIGVMGRSMASNLMKAGYDVTVYTRTPSKAASLVEEGAKWVDSVKEIASNCNVIMTMVGYPKDVEEVYLNENGLLENSKKGTYFIDFTTSTPSLAKKIEEEANERGMHALDAPVSGGDIGAKEGKLAIMVGGSKEVYDTCLPILNVLGTNIIYQGEAGAGQHTKMCNQITIASNMMGVCEAMAYAKKAGLNPERVLESISTGAAGSWSLSNLAPRMLQKNYDPGFYIKHFVKDMNIAIEECEKMGLIVPGLMQAKKLYDAMVQNGDEDLGTQALIKLYE
ncbi:MAG: NAD(P)-dependent oxidoreductase [Bacillaceae bacterium]